jgi:hypothetical protein
LADTGWFDARGMRSPYGRADKIPDLPAYHLDMWVAKGGRVFIRFWSRGSYVGPLSFELRGADLQLAAAAESPRQNQHLVPAIVRDRYDEWVVDRVEYPYE